MRIVKHTDQLRRILEKTRARHKSIGFVPTMGALHAGHQALLRQSKKQNDLTVLSIFVNPAQFGPNEDFAKYPRDLKKDVLLAKKENIDIIFYPSVEEIYPKRYLTYIHLEEIMDTLCGRSRPGHFSGVATVVAKLLNIVQPRRLYLGAKDAQQCVVIRQMIQDLNFPVEVKVIPTVREKDGLAMSSRNQYLNPTQRREAATLYQALRLARQTIKQGEHQASHIRRLIRNMIQQKTSGHIDYVECVAANSLRPLSKLKGSTLLALAVRFGRARLIDNITITV